MSTNILSTAYVQSVLLHVCMMYVCMYVYAYFLFQKIRTPDNHRYDTLIYVSLMHHAPDLHIIQVKLIMHYTVWIHCIKRIDLDSRNFILVLPRGT